MEMRHVRFELHRRVEGANHHKAHEDQTHPTNSQDLRTDHQHRVGWVNKGLGAGKGWWINTQKSAQA